LETWNETYFDGRLSSAVLAHLTQLEHPEQRPEVRAFLERAFRHMQRARFPPSDFTAELAGQFAHIAAMVQEAWEGVIPPFTLDGRHRKIDDYIECHAWFQANPSGTLVDIGCGFPPVTTVETATRFPRWQVIGSDPALPYYLVQDEHGNYALFDEGGSLQYFQGGNGRALDVWQDPESARVYFNTLLQRLLRASPSRGSEAMGSAGTGPWLVQNPAWQYERPNLSFKKGAIGALDMQDIHIIRCFNVLFYFDRPFRARALDWFASILYEGGLAICGVNGFRSTRCRYTVYRRVGKRLVEEEFAFSLDNVRPLGSISWSTFHDDDEETRRLATLVGVLRADKPFQHDFDTRLDALLSRHSLFARNDKGYLVELPSELSPEKREKCQFEIGEQLDKEGYVERAAAVLKQAGYKARRNDTGHVAVRS
jgi:hypothetical protein